ncbi:MAG: radical SAM protein [Methanomicrobiaceae archaeon]|nr:radical SAM protein [Methanomicrobiaceae archaeon]
MAEPDSVVSGGCLHPDSSEVTRFFEESKVYSVQIESCLSCPQGCRYCYAAAEDAPSAELPKASIIRLLDEAVALDVRAIDWLGGDPLMRSDWYELIEAAQGRGLKNNIWTSGMPLSDPLVAEQVVKASDGGFISVHLDTLDETIYGALHTGNPAGKIRAILEGVEHLLRCGKNPDEIINCITFTRPLAGEDVERTIRFFASKGIRTCLTQICMAGLGAEHPEWVPTPDEIRHAIDVRDRVNYPGSPLSMSTMDVNKFYCSGIVCVTVDGDVTPCSVIRKSFGNIGEMPFREIINKNRRELTFAPLRNGETPNKCTTCQNKPVCWGCRATAYYTSGDMMGEDPNCPYTTGGDTHD